jgi:hypothetical protein
VLAKKNAPFVANLIRDDQTICNYFNIWEGLALCE